MVRGILDKIRSINWLYKLVLQFFALFSKPLNTANLQFFFLFVGYPRSGHTLVGALLDAHPSLMCSIESNALLLYRMGYSRRLLFYFLQKRNNVFVNRFSAMWTGYSYKVEGAFQGNSTNLLAIGDKKGAGTTKQLINNFSLLAEFEQAIALPVKIVHVIRNPYDNIATIMLRAAQKGKNCNRTFFEERLDYYKKHVETNQKIIANNPGKVLNVYHEDLIEDPKGELEKIVSFLGASADEDYLSKCSKLVYSSPNKTRHKIEWLPGMKEKVEAIISEVDFLKRYNWHS